MSKFRRNTSKKSSTGGGRKDFTGNVSQSRIHHQKIIAQKHKENGEKKLTNDTDIPKSKKVGMNGKKITKYKREAA